jgi:isopentenyl diphosphate isomerase/L-lactate dehydrogenase-like FMN-dependent dehydrogenase
LGRPVLYALASYGRDGIKAMIDEITNELKRLMSMVGAPDPGSVGRDVLIED